MPDMREKVEEYINELKTEIENLEVALGFRNGMSIIDQAVTYTTIKTLSEVINDLKSRLAELI